MSIKYYNPDLKTWVAYTSNYATGIRIIDTDGNFIETSEEGVITRSHTVEEALKFLSRRMGNMHERVEWIYENGTIGGGGGGTGGSILPNLKLVTPGSTTDAQDYASIDISTDTEVTIEYTFQSPNIGPGTASYIVTGDASKRVTEKVNQGINKFSLGKFETGSYKVNIYVIDAAGLFSNTLTVVINAGGLEIRTSFKDSIDYTLDDNIVIDYEVQTVSKLPINMTFTLNGVKTERVLDSGGAYKWTIGKLPYTGVHKATISAISGDFVANEVKISIVVADPANMFITSDFPTESQILAGRDLVIPYRAAMAGETKALIHKWMNGEKQPIDTVFIGTGNYLFWKLGDTLEPATYEFEIQASTIDERLFSEKLRFTVEVVTQSFARIHPVQDDYLVASFLADNKSSTSETRNVWEDRSGNNVACTLHNFNHVTNGWDGYALNLSGRAYAEIDLAPWATNCQNGFTFDIFYKTENIGDLDAKVLWMKNFDTPYQGFFIDSQRANMMSGSSKTIETFLEDSSEKENWQHVTFVVNRDTDLMEMFVNGILTQGVRLSQTENFTFGGKIYLGGRFTGTEIDQQGKCSIRAIHVYNRTLTDDEIVQNYISCLAYPDAQEKVYRLNYDDQQIPRMDITGDVTGISSSKDVIKEISVSYMDYRDMTNSFTLSTCLLSMQGTSSSIYPVINYTLQLKENGQDHYRAPNKEWIPESRFTLKAN